MLNEKLTKTDKEEIKSLINRAIDKEMAKLDSRFKEEFKKNKEFEKRSKKLSTEVLNDFVKFLYMKKNVWNSSTK